MAGAGDHVLVAYPNNLRRTIDEHVWTLNRRGQELRCELRGAADERACVEVRLYEDDCVVFIQRCTRELNARRVAACLRVDSLQEGWIEIVTDVAKSA